MKNSSRAEHGVERGVDQNGPTAKSSCIELSGRQIEALTWVARGKTSAEIAIILGLAKRTVDFHIESACMKLGVTRRVEAVLKAALRRMIETRFDACE
jgi:DNA-binding CsgD family transcriptional regulator